MRLLSLVYNGIAPAQEKQYLQSLDPSCKSLASGLLELAFAFGGLVGKIAASLLPTCASLKSVNLDVLYMYYN